MIRLIIAALNICSIFGSSQVTTNKDSIELVEAEYDELSLMIEYEISLPIDEAAFGLEQLVTSMTKISEDFDEMEVIEGTVAILEDEQGMHELPELEDYLDLAGMLRSDVNKVKAVSEEVEKLLKKADLKEDQLKRLYERLEGLKSSRWSNVEDSDEDDPAADVEHIMMEIKGSLSKMNENIAGGVMTKKRAMQKATHLVFRFCQKLAQFLTHCQTTLSLDRLQSEELLAGLQATWDQQSYGNLERHLHHWRKHHEQYLQIRSALKAMKKLIGGISNGCLGMEAGRRKISDLPRQLLRAKLDALVQSVQPPPVEPIAIRDQFLLDKWDLDRASCLSAVKSKSSSSSSSSSSAEDDSELPEKALPVKNHPKPLQFILSGRPPMDIFESLDSALLVNPFACGCHTSALALDCSREPNKENPCKIFVSAPPNLSENPGFQDKHVKHMSLMNLRGIAKCREAIFNQFTKAIQVGAAYMVIGQFGCDQCQVNMIQLGQLYLEASEIFAGKGNLKTVFFTDPALFKGIFPTHNK